MIVGITGATGFIGRPLMQRHLENNDTVRILTRQTNPDIPYTDSIQSFTSNLSASNSKELEPFVENVDVLYHCAAELAHKEEMYDLHVRGTEKLIQAAAGRIGRWVQLSSVGVYESCNEGTVTEKQLVKPRGIYEQTKARADELVQQADKNNAFETVILRPSIVFGPTMHNQSLFQLISIIKRGLFFYTGSQEAFVNYIHIANVVEALWLCATHNNAQGKTFIISDHLPLSTFISEISTSLNCPEPRLHLPELPMLAIAGLLGWIPGFPLTTSRIKAMNNRCIYSSEKIKQELGYCEKMPLIQGLRELILSRERQG